MPRWKVGEKGRGVSRYETRAERRGKRNTLLLSGAAERPEETETTGSDTGCRSARSLVAALRVNRALRLSAINRIYRRSGASKRGHRVPSVRLARSPPLLPRGDRWRK